MRHYKVVGFENDGPVFWFTVAISKSTSQLVTRRCWQG